MLGDEPGLTAVELTAAVVRRARGAGIPSADLQATLAAFRGDWSTEYRVIEVTVALAAGASPGDAARLANIAGGIVVMKRGTGTVTPRELSESLGRDGTPRRD